MASREARADRAQERLRSHSALAAFRPPVRTGIGALDSHECDGLHFVGASTRPGNGVPLVLMGVKVVFEAIMKQHGAGVKAR